MKVEHDGKTYVVRWSHYSTPESAEKYNKKLPTFVSGVKATGMTECEVKVYCDSQPDTCVESYTSVAYCSENDKYVRYHARKLTLTRAIRGLTREERTAIWDEFKRTIRTGPRRRK